MFTLPGSIITKTSQKKIIKKVSFFLKKIKYFLVLSINKIKSPQNCKMNHGHAHGPHGHCGPDCGCFPPQQFPPHHNGHAHGPHGHCGPNCGCYPQGHFPPQHLPHNPPPHYEPPHHHQPPHFPPQINNPNYPQYPGGQHPGHPNPHFPSFTPYTPPK